MHQVTDHSTNWRWWVSVLLLLATMINYMDRQTLANLSVTIKKEFKLTDEQYGDMEYAFGFNFALGALTFGAIADRVSVRLLYPCVLLAWSLMGVLTGLTNGYESMMNCRRLLGFFEAGHWPCALIVMHTVMTRGDRVMGDSVLQSGASIGAIATPIVILLLVPSVPMEVIPDSVSMFKEPWRLPFLIIGAVGMLWAFLWFSIVKKGDFEPVKRTGPVESSWNLNWLVGFVRNPNFWALFVMVICNNTAWQIIRAWLPSFLETGRGYSRNAALWFNSAYYIATDVGCLLAGVMAMQMHRRGMEVHRARVIVYGICAGLTALTLAAGNMPQGIPLLAVLLLIAGGSLGLFPCYYSFTQEISSKNLGKASGLLGFVGWMASSPIQKLFGWMKDRTGSYDLGFSLVGLAPLLGLFAMLLLWRNDPKQ